MARLITKTFVNDGAEMSAAEIVEIDVDAETHTVNFLVFKDTTNGKKYKLQVTNGAIELVEVV